MANTDASLLLTFREFLTTCCSIDTSRIHYSIVCFNDSDPIEVKAYWSKMLGIASDKFGKIVQIPTQGKGTYRKKSRYGVCTIEFSNIKLKKWIMQELYKMESSPV